MSKQNGYEQFVDDDPGYLRWLSEKPSGFVVNSHRRPASNYLVLHRASCNHINSPNRSNWTTKGFIKTCSTDITALENWARQATGGHLRPCDVCKPNDPARSASPPPSPISEEHPGSAVVASSPP